MWTLLLLWTTAFAGVCEDTASRLVAEEDFQKGFHESVASSSAASFMQGMRASGITDEKVLQFASDYYTPKIRAFFDSNRDMLTPAVEAWVVASLGCDTLETLAATEPFGGWDAVPEAKLNDMPKHLGVMREHAAMGTMLQGVQKLVADTEADFKAKLREAGLSRETSPAE